MPLGDSAREMEDLDFLGAHLPQLVAQGTSVGRDRWTLLCFTQTHQLPIALTLPSRT